MPILVLGLGLLFGISQSLWLTDCPCNLLCRDKNGCDPKEATEDDCCKQTGAAPHSHEEGKGEGPCFHVEPQTDVDGPGPALDLAPPILTLAFGADPESAAGPPERPETSLPRPARDRPLYLRHATLRI